MPTTCTITFDNRDGVYYAGQRLHGTVALTLTSEKKIRGIFVKIVGRAYAHWTEHCSIDHNPTRDSKGNLKHNSGHYVDYYGEEDYLNERSHFVGRRDGESFNMAPGTYNYTFQCMLPAGLPTSVQHSVGHISYSATVVMDIPFWPDKEFQQNFSVIKPINLNYSPMLRSPGRAMSEQSFYPMGIFCCCPYGPLKIESRTPVQGYAPGQTVNVNIYVSNESSCEVTDLEVQLNKQITFHGRANEAYHHGDRRTKTVNETIREKMIAGCKAKSETSAHVDIRVPAIPPTDTSTSRLVEVRYTMRVAGTVDSCCNSIDAHDLPITIGTIPIQDNFQEPNMSQPVFTNQPTSSQNGASVPSANHPPFPKVTPIPSSGQPTAPRMPDLPNMPNASSMPFAPSMPGTSGMPSALMATDAPSAPAYDFSENPPTYEEAVAHGGEPSDIGFKPKYPMFRRQTSYSIDTSKIPK